MRQPIVSLALLALAAVAGPAHAEWTRVPVVRLHATAEIAAPPAAIWAQITQGKNLVTWCPVWKGAPNAARSLAKVGDTVDYMDQWGHGGRSIATYVAPMKEIRVAHEPNDGSYMCQAKFALEAKGAGTVVHFWEQYTDESSAADLQATAGKMETEMAQTLATLKQRAERK